MPSQYGEDRFILDYFRGRCSHGRFLDIGAYNGVALSNTLPLLDAGWEGTYLEPSAAPFASLLQNVGNRKPTPILIHAALHPTAGLIPWWDANGDAISTSKAAHCKVFHDHSYTFCWTCGITWDQLLEVAPGPYDFMNFDVEGRNSELIQLAPLEKIGAKLICFEYDPVHEDGPPALAYFAAHGYQVITRIGNLLLEKTCP